MSIEIDAGEGVLTEEGSIIYDNDENTSMCVQVLEEGEGEDQYISTRTMISIENADAPREYSFGFDLPSGFEIIADYDYNMKVKQELIDNRDEIINCGTSEEEFQEMISSYDETFGEYYVIDEDGIVVQVIDAAWAKDAEGGDVYTYYELRDSKLVQIVDFDENSLFPIIADPTVGETKSFSQKVSNATMGDLSSYVSAGALLGTGAKKAAAKLGRKKLLKVTGSKLLPGAGTVATFVALFATINSKTGKKGIEFYGTLKYMKHTNHKEGTTRYLWGIKTLKIRRY